MSDQTKEKLSAYLDDELELAQLSRLAGELEGNDELRGKLNRYALISETIKGNCSNCNAAEIVDTVHDSLEEEPTVFAPSQVDKPVNTTWKTYLGGAAVAATVAALAVFNIGSFNNQQATGIDEFPVTVNVQNTAPAPYRAGIAQRASTKWKTGSAASPEIEDELNQFLIDHSEYTTQSGIPGLLPYATIVVYDKQ